MTLQGGPHASPPHPAYARFGVSSCQLHLTRSRPALSPRSLHVLEAFRYSEMAHLLRGKQAGVQVDLSAGVNADLFAIDDV
jgi:hypothetical protein